MHWRGKACVRCEGVKKAHAPGRRVLHLGHGAQSSIDARRCEYESEVFKGAAVKQIV